MVYEARYSLQRFKNTNSSDADHGEEAVSKDGRNTVCIYPGLGHEVQKRVDRRRAEESDAIDISKLRFS